MSTKECPNCGAEHKQHIKRCGCGYQFGSKTEVATVARDPMFGCCEYSTGTSRCHYAGTFSESVTGGGKWLCRAHEKETDPSIGASIVYKSHEDYPNPDYSVAAIKRRYELRIRKAVAEYSGTRATKFKPGSPGKDWARRIMERKENGEQMPIIALEMASEVLGIDK